jgi:hypothetical protein
MQAQSLFINNQSLHPMFPSDNSTVYVSGLAAATLAFVALKHLLAVRRDTLPLPPGPKRLPILGNLLDFPTELRWLTYNKWSKEYGGRKFTTPIS